MHTTDRKRSPNGESPQKCNGSPKSQKNSVFVTGSSGQKWHHGFVFVAKIGAANEKSRMNELQHSLQHMGVLQYLMAVVFVICYALALGDFLGPNARWGLAVIAATCAVVFSVLSDYWVHGVLLTVFVLVGMGLFIGCAWLLKILVLGWQKRSPDARHQAAFKATQAADAQAFAQAYAGNDEHASVEHARG
jgi:hypothetical protein